MLSHVFRWTFPTPLPLLFRDHSFDSVTLLLLPQFAGPDEGTCFTVVSITMFLKQTQP